MRSVKPDIIFLQECTLRDTNLNARAANLFSLLLTLLGSLGSGDPGEVGIDAIFWINYA
jgi:hypothetical protein